MIIRLRLQGKSQCHFSLFTNFLTYVCRLWILYMYETTGMKEKSHSKSQNIREVFVFLQIPCVPFT